MEAWGPRRCRSLQERHSQDEDATVSCWGLDPGNDYVAYMDFVLETKTIKPDARKRALAAVEKSIRDECEAAGSRDSCHGLSSADFLDRE